MAEAQFVPGDSLPSQIQVEVLSGGLEVAPSTLTPRNLSSRALALIQHFEGWSPKAYDDATGYCTIGYGHLIALHHCAAIPLGEFSNGISTEKGKELLDHDILWARIAVQRSVAVDLSDDEFGALVSFTFNVGERNLKESLLVKYLESRDFHSANLQFGLWTKAGGKVQNGLVIRRRCEAALFRGELIVTGDRVNTATCAALDLSGSADRPIDIVTGRTD